MRTGGQTREAIKVDGSQQFEEANTMLGEFCKVLVNHVERRFKDGIKNRRHLWCEQGLPITSQSDPPEQKNPKHTPRRPVMVAITLRTSASRAVATLRL